MEPKCKYCNNEATTGDPNCNCICCTSEYASLENCDNKVCRDCYISIMDRIFKNVEAKRKTRVNRKKNEND